MLKRKIFLLRCWQNILLVHSVSKTVASVAFRWSFPTNLVGWHFRGRGVCWFIMRQKTPSPGGKGSNEKENEQTNKSKRNRDFVVLKSFSKRVYSWAILAFPDISQMLMCPIFISMCYIRRFLLIKQCYLLVYLKMVRYVC